MAKTPGSGRQAGTPNKATGIAREAIAKFVDGNIDKLQVWLDAIAADPKHGPMVAYGCLMDVLEYHVPKLARTEHTAADGGPLQVNIVRFGDK